MFLSVHDPKCFWSLACWRRRWCFQHVAGLWRVVFLFFSPMKYIYIYAYIQNKHIYLWVFILCGLATESFIFLMSTWKVLLWDGGRQARAKMRDGWPGANCHPDVIEQDIFLVGFCFPWNLVLLTFESTLHVHVFASGGSTDPIFSHVCFGTYLTHVQTCGNVRVQSATEWAASVHTWHMYNVRFQSATECTASVHTWHVCVQSATECFSTYLTHVQTCDIVRVRRAAEWTASVHTWHMYNVRFQSATECTASVHTWHMSKPVVTFVFKVLQNASVHIWHMSKPVISFVFDVLRNGLLRYILDTCPNLWYRSCSKCYGMHCFSAYLTHVQTCGNVCVQSATECFSTYLTHVQTCDDVRVQSATEWFASVHTWHMSKPAITFMFKVLGDGLIRCILDTCPNPR